MKKQQNSFLFQETDWFSKAIALNKEYFLIASPCGCLRRFWLPFNESVRRRLAGRFTVRKTKPFQECLCCVTWASTSRSTSPPRSYRRPPPCRGRGSVLRCVTSAASAKSAGKGRLRLLLVFCCCCCCGCCYVVV